MARAKRHPPEACPHEPDTSKEAHAIALQRTQRVRERDGRLRPPIAVQAKHKTLPIREREEIREAPPGSRPNKRRRKNQQPRGERQQGEGRDEVDSTTERSMSLEREPDKLGNGRPKEVKFNPNLIPLGPNARLIRNNESLHIKQRSPALKSPKREPALPTDREAFMAPGAVENGHAAPVGPHPSFIEVAKPYVFEQKLQQCMSALGKAESTDWTVRLQGVRWIDDVRRALSLPIRTFNTAVVYYHKFRLQHADKDYNYLVRRFNVPVSKRADFNKDAAAAALFTACKIEDTLKKSREILCAAFNLKIANTTAEQLSPDDPLFEHHSKSIIGLERLMLEGASFDFRNRHPQRIAIKLVRACGLPKASVGALAYSICADLYRTFAPLKQTTSTMAIACVELAVRLCNADIESVSDDCGIDYGKWQTSRAEVMETMLDLLELYTHHRGATVVGPSHPVETFINIRITLNQESTTKSLPRYTSIASSPHSSPSTKTKAPNGTTKHANGNTAPTSPATPSTLIASPAQGVVPNSTGARGTSGTVRFMLGAARAKEEQETVESYFKVEEEEYEVEVEVEVEVLADSQARSEREKESDRARDRDRQRDKERMRDRSRDDRYDDRSSRAARR